MNAGARWLLPPAREDRPKWRDNTRGWVRPCLRHGTLRSPRPRGEKRRAILDAATAVFLKHGYTGATIDLVVARAGASKATIYRFFGGKEGLFNALVNERTDTILAGFPDIEIAEIDFRSALADIARQYMKVLMSPDAVGLYRLLLAEGPRFPDLVESFYRIGQDRVSVRLAKALRTWARHGRICMVDADRIATQFFDVVRGELYLRALAGLPPDDPAQPSRATSIMPCVLARA